jgi:hypothetical protein
LEYRNVVLEKHSFKWDEDEARLAARFAAFLLEPREDIAEGQLKIILMR